MKIACIVLAAGGSTRFGTDNKLLADLCGKQLMQWTLEALPLEIFSHILVVSSDSDVTRLAQGCGFACAQYAGGMLSDSIREGLSHIPPDTDGFMFVNADRPFLTKTTLRNMAHIFSEHPQSAVRLGWEGVPSNPVLFPAATRGDLMALKGDRGGNALIKSGKCACIPVEAQWEEETWDADTPASLEKLRSIGGNKGVHDQ